MQIVNIHEAKTNLSKLLAQVLAGEDVVIAKAGKPVAKIILYEEKLEPRKMGELKGEIWISDDFDDEDEELNKLFYEGDI